MTETFPERTRAAVAHLRRRDPVMRGLIDRVGRFTLRPQRERFRLLIRAIISQQISTKAARSIRRRVEALVRPQRPTAARLAEVPPEQLRSAGLSPQKAGYVHDLCEKVAGGVVRLRTIGRLSDEEAIEELTQVKGIGRWTAQMFLIFALGRLDVLPHDDLGLRSALRELYDLSELPDKATCHEIAEPWRPYASVATWYCWRHCESAPPVSGNGAGYPV